ncbi:MAG: hypothetical protein FJ265_18145 [Planctomycetes bacterium]|nr:hypothetical protein [Planctomycetota bacterium]
MTGAGNREPALERLDIIDAQPRDLGAAQPGQEHELEQVGVPLPARVLLGGDPDAAEDRLDLSALQMVAASARRLRQPHAAGFDVERVVDQRAARGPRGLEHPLQQHGLGADRRTADAVLLAPVRHAGAHLRRTDAVHLGRVRPRPGQRAVLVLDEPSRAFAHAVRRHVLAHQLPRLGEGDQAAGGRNFSFPRNRPSQSAASSGVA